MKHRLIIEILTSLLLFVHLYAGFTKVVANDVFESQLSIHAVIGNYSEVLAIAVPSIESKVGIVLLRKRTF